MDRWINFRATLNRTSHESWSSSEPQRLRQLTETLKHSQEGFERWDLTGCECQLQTAGGYSELEVVRHK